MRLLLDLRNVSERAEREQLAREAEEHGIWGVVVTGPQGAECVEASAIATATRHVIIVVDVDGNDVHPTTLAEEISVLDQITKRRTMVIFRGPSTSKTSIAALLSGLPVDGVILSPPPAQASIPVHSPVDIPETNLSEDLTQLAAIVDQYRDSQTAFLIVSWERSVKELARHALGRAASTDFPQMVADMADQIDPIDQ
ncbi:MAG: hypothetical protein ACJZ57_01755 [Candidatus Poriferisodalaceae bacterium]|nr:MAG: hypothetical protein CNE88_08500 [Acidimicrobiales bacterium MED-G01]